MKRKNRLLVSSSHQNFPKTIIIKGAGNAVNIKHLTF